MTPAVARGLLVKEEKDMIFSNILLIYGVNTQLKNSLTEVNPETGEDPKGTSVSKIFAGVCDFLKMYSTYCTKYPPAIDYVQSLMGKNGAFEAFCREVKENTPERLDIMDLLIKPVQRICKYPLLFRELLRNTAETHKERAMLIEVQEKLEAVAAHVNESKRNAENLQEVLNIANQLDDVPKDFVLVEPNRRLLLRDTLRISVNGKPTKNYETLLFNDILLQTKKRMMLGKNKRYVFKEKVNIPQALVRDIPPSNATTDDITPLQLELVGGQGKETKQFIITFKDLEEKERWKKEIVALKLKLQEEELTKKNIRTVGAVPKRKAGVGGDTGEPKGASVYSEKKLEGSPVVEHRADLNSLKVMGGGGGVSKRADNIEAFRMHNLSKGTTFSPETSSSGLGVGSGALPSSPLAGITEANLDPDGEFVGDSTDGLEKIRRAIQLEDTKREAVEKDVSQAEADTQAAKLLAEQAALKVDALEKQLAQFRNLLAAQAPTSGPPTTARSTRGPLPNPTSYKQPPSASPKVSV
eukprot:TRINITY_DN1900_c1_g2_i2.p1 TRINITY_DN1900_c1_g2~~TRINITY_DN1900_c1_g2_i2.p1  ORF type:complete len:526 (+),score=103.43 TRINITY_DN1900_c1_g2_i2:149-1726(+)